MLDLLALLILKKPVLAWAKVASTQTMFSGAFAISSSQKRLFWNNDIVRKNGKGRITVGRISHLGEGVGVPISSVQERTTNEGGRDILTLKHLPSV